ncbi:MAG: AMP-binding protein, partial [Pseudomonadota bacterium]
LTDCEAALVVTSQQTRGTVDPCPCASVDIDDLLKASPTAHALPQLQPDDKAYVMYTSGSTGDPKGVVVNHANLRHTTLSRRLVYGDGPNVFLLLSAFSFDSSVAGLFWTLCAGGALVLVRPRAEQDLQALSALIEREAVTHTLCLPSLYRLVLEEGEALGSLQTVIVAGEAVPADLALKHRARLPAARLFNEYGPTEASVWCTTVEITDHRSGPVPIGEPIENTTIRLLDRWGGPTPLGSEGEIVIEGHGVAEGYFGPPDASAKAFSADQRSEGGVVRAYHTGDLGQIGPDNQLYFLGRLDEQVKVRGIRIELAEIAACLRRHPGVSDAIAIMHDGLLGFVVARTISPSLNLDDVLSFAATWLPPAMRPTRLISLETLPTLPNGKIDHAALLTLAKEKDWQRPQEDRPPQTDFERTLCEIWSALLGKKITSVHANFFDEGGNSLLSIRVVSRARQAGIVLQPGDIFDFPTIAELSHHIDHSNAVQDTPPTTNANGPSKASNLFFMIHGGKRLVGRLRAHLGTERPVHFIEDHWDSGDLAPDARVETMAQTCLAEIKAVQPEGPYVLGGYSVGAPIAYDVAFRLQAAGDAVELLLLLDPPLDPLPEHEAEAQSTSPGTPQAHSKRTLLGKIRVHAGTLRRRPLAEWPAYLWRRLGTLWLVHVQSPLRFSIAAAGYRLGRVPDKLRTFYVGRVYYEAYDRYTAPDYRGPLLVFRRNDPGAGRASGRLFTRAPGLIGIEEFECGHYDFRRDPAIVEAWTARLAEHVRHLPNRRPGGGE